MQKSLTDLTVDAALQEKMWVQGVADSDLRSVIFHAQQTAEKFLDHQTGHWIACEKRKVTTLWVEYSMDKTGSAVVYNCYSHRMQVL